MKHQTHKWDQFKRLKWPVCVYCGLIALRNEITAKLMRKSCPGEEDGS